ncbi:MAG: hypothetical protein H7Y09_14710 [Chitinophagaceae bacterium]|nr:hypothetical protein [Anaerolineae bacterium]
MSEILIQTLKDWQNFYFMTGSASATLIGLMFVAVSLGSNMIDDHASLNFQLFVTPVVVHFTIVLVLAALMIIPSHTPISLGSFLILIGTISAAYTIRLVWMMTQHPQSQVLNKGHYFWHGAFPVISYFGVFVGGMGIFASEWRILDLVALLIILLLVSSIRNAWYLILWIALNRSNHEN